MIDMPGSDDTPAHKRSPKDRRDEALLPTGVRNAEVYEEIKAHVDLYHDRVRNANNASQDLQETLGLGGLSPLRGSQEYGPLLDQVSSCAPDHSRREAVDAPRPQHEHDGVDEETPRTDDMTKASQPFRQIQPQQQEVQNPSVTPWTEKNNKALRAYTEGLQRAERDQEPSEVSKDEEAAASETPTRS